jgi:hypothetical protein
VRVWAFVRGISQPCHLGGRRRHGQAKGLGGLGVATTGVRPGGAWLPRARGVLSTIHPRLQYNRYRSPLCPRRAFARPTTWSVRSAPSSVLTPQHQCCNS